MLSRVRCWGNIETQDDKLVAEYRVADDILDIDFQLHWWATDIASSALGYYGVTDQRSWDAIETKRSWLCGNSTDDDLKAARIAAQDAAQDAALIVTWDATWNAARNAARIVARDAARSTAWNVAWSTAWNAAQDATWNASRSATRDELNDSLESYILEQIILMEEL